MRIRKYHIYIYIYAILSLLLCRVCAVAAYAADDAPDADRAWAQAVDAVLDEYDVTRDQITAGYLNLVTGEEHYINGDEYKVAGSMYKVPLNMYVTSLIASGALDWQAHYPNITYEYVRRASLIDSSNDWSMFLCRMSAVGGYNTFREVTAPYMGLEADELDARYKGANSNTSRQFIHCLKLLYDSRESFPEIIETMQQAERERFFLLNESRFDIAHKYGYVSEDYHSYMNDCAIAFTAQPIAIVMFTENVVNAEELLSAYCTAMCEYTNRAVEAERAAALTAAEAAATPPVAEDAPSADSAALPAAPIAALVLIPLCVAAAVYYRRARR